MWVWRRVTSRWARRIWFCLAVATLLVSTALRIRAGLFEHRVSRIVHALAQVRLDQTTKTDLLATVPGLQPGAPSGTKCRTEECYSEEISNWTSSLEFHLLAELHSTLVYELGYWLGFRLWLFSADVELRHGKVHKLEYALLLDDGSGGYPGTLDVDVESVRGFSSWSQSDFDDESPDYLAESYFKWPELTLRVVFTPAAQGQLVKHAFDLHLNCVWQLRGCRTARQLLPVAWDDKQAIESAAVARIQSSDPCPDRILFRQARDTGDILLVEVARLRPDLETGRLAGYRMADYRLLQVLKGKVNRPLAGVAHSPTMYVPSSYLQVSNPATKLLYPGSRVLMFSRNYTSIGGPCDIVAATPSALEALRTALASPSSQVVDSDRSRW